MADLFAEESDTMETLPHMSEDKEEAAKQYKLIREYARETFENFLRNLNSQTLRSIENTFHDNDGELDISTFLEMCPGVFPKPDYKEFPEKEEQEFIVNLAAKMLFEDVDVDRSGGADWIEFVDFVCAVDETIRIQSEEGAAQQFDFHESQKISLQYRPQITKSKFDKVFFWPQHSSDKVIVFEEGQGAFHLHKPLTMQRVRKADGHRNDCLAAVYIPDYDWVVTSGNDKLLCFWDGNFTLIKRWKLETVIGNLCWCPEIKALYFSEFQFTEKLQAWRIADPFKVKDPSEKTLPVSRQLTFNTGHTKSIQEILWISPSQCLVTASLDTTVRIFDCIRQPQLHLHTFSGHTKGLTCLDYCPALQLLLSAGFNNYINLWDAAAGVRFHTLKGHECSIIAIRAVPGTDHEFVSCDLHGVVKLWDLRRLACTQSFHATDFQAEKAGEIEPLNVRTLCFLSRDRLLISGRRMVLFERDCSQPQLTADSGIMAIAFSHRKFEIATTIKDSVCVWCALSGKVVAVHNHVINGNITAITLSIGERRCFVGSDLGHIEAINFACGAHLKSLMPHAAEVSQITCIQDKVLTLSTAERLVRVHDDTNPEKPVVLKEIDLSHVEPILSISFNGEEIICGGTEDGVAVWFAITFAKQISSTEHSIVKHDGPVTCCLYLESAPLVATSDSESCVILWSVQPLRSFQFFCKLILSLVPTEARGPDPGLSSTVGITSMAFSWPDEESLIVGTEIGTLACFDLTSIIQGAKRQKNDIMHKKNHGHAADVISGKIFESMPKPDNSEDYVRPMKDTWLLKRAHRGSIDQVIFTKLHRPVIISLGFDQRVCLWNPEDGEPLGTLEQGVPEGLSYQRQAPWRFPIDAHDQVNLEIRELKEAAEPEEEEEDGGAGSDKDISQKSGSADQKSDTRRDSTDEKSIKMNKSQSSPDMNAYSRNKFNLPDFTKTQSRLLDLPKHKRVQQDNEWLSGPFAPSFLMNPNHLPMLQSGRLRPVIKESKRNDVVAAAKRLSYALGSLKRSNSDLRSFT